jgi:streptogramin lyase
MRIARALTALLFLFPPLPVVHAAGFVGDGEAIPLDQAIPANERGILCLAADGERRIYGGTTGRAAHLFLYDPQKKAVRSLARLDGGVGFAYTLLRLPDGSLIAGTQADPTGIAVKTDPRAVGHLYRFTPTANGPAKVEDLGVPVPGQGIYTLAFLDQAQEVVGNTWPDGHFFSYHFKAKKFHDQGAIAGYRTYETPQHAEDLNRGTGEQLSYPRQVSRAILVDPEGRAYTGGADGFLYRYDPRDKKIKKLELALPALPGRGPWASLDAVAPGRGQAVQLGGTSDGYLFAIFFENGRPEPRLQSLGKALRQGAVQGLVTPSDDCREACGVGGDPGGMPRWFRLTNTLGPAASAPHFETALTPGGIPVVDGQVSMIGFGALLADGPHALYAGERDRIARLVRYPLAKVEKAPPQPPAAVPAAPPPAFDAPAKLDCRVVFAPQGTTTDGSGYTAIEVGKDGRVYVGAARYGGYAWLLRFDPAAAPLFMDKVVSMQQLTGERRAGINTQGKIHAKIIVGDDGRVWFASKQAHEIFDTRPEYGEDPDGFPGGHLCYFDPRTGFSRSMGILKKQEGLMCGAIDNARGKLYYRSEPKNHFLVYDLKTGDVQDRGHVGAFCRYSAIDQPGAVYCPGRGQYLARYDPETGYVEDLAIKVEGSGGYLAPYVIAVGPNGKLYGVAAAHPWLMEFDIDHIKGGPFPEVTMRNVAPAAPAGLPVLDIHAGVFGKDGKFYYPLNTSGPLAPGGKPEPHLRIMRFDPATKKVETAGIPHVVGLDEAKVKHAYTRPAKYVLQYMQGAAVGADGSLYLMAIYPQLSVACFPKLTAPK